MSYPCTCLPCESCVTVSCSDSGNCLKVASMVIDPTTSVGPCGQAGTVDIAAVSDLTNCTTTIVWSIQNWDTTAFESVSISAAGVLSFTSTSAAVPRKYYRFTGQAYCNNTLLSQYFYVDVPIKDLCYGIFCPTAGTSCNPCTGACFASPDVALT